MTSSRPRRHGNGSTVEGSSIKQVKEICKDCTDDDAQAALLEHNGDVHSAVMSLLDNPFQSVEKKKRRPQQKPVDREARYSSRDSHFRENDRRGHEKYRSAGRGRGGDRTYDNDAPSTRGRGRGGRGRGRGGASRVVDTNQAHVEENQVDTDFGNSVAAYASPAPEDTAVSTVTARVQPFNPPRPVSSTVVNDGSVSWASKVKTRTVPVQQVYEPEPANDFEDRGYGDANSDTGINNGISNEPVESEPNSVLTTPTKDNFGSGFGHDTKGGAWDGSHQASAWQSVSAAPDIPIQEHLEEAQPPGMTVNSQTYPESKTFDLRDLGGALPQAGGVPEESDYFDIPTQEGAQQPAGFGPPGLQQGSPLTMFSNRSRTTQPTESATVASDSCDPASIIGGSFDFSHSMASVSMAPTAAHHSSNTTPQAPLHSHQQATAPLQTQPEAEIPNSQPSSVPQNQQEPSAQPATSHLPTDAHTHTFESQFPGHSAQDGHLNTAAKVPVPASAGMFMTENTRGEQLAPNDVPQAQAAQPQEQDKPYSTGEQQPHSVPADQQHPPLQGQPYQQHLPHELNNWGVHAMQADLYSMQRPGSAQLGVTPPAMQGMVHGMGQIPNQHFSSGRQGMVVQMQAQYPINPSIPAAAYGAPGYPTPNYQQLGYAPAPYLQPGYNVQYANSGYPYGQMAPQAYAPSPSGPQMYGGHTGFGKQTGFIGDYGARTQGTAAGSMPGGSGRGRGRGKNQKGRMAPTFAPQGTMHDPYNTSQGGYMDPNWVAQPQRLDSSFSKDSKLGQPHQYPPFAPGGYENTPYGYSQFAQHSQYAQQAWNGQEKGVGGAKGNF